MVVVSSGVALNPNGSPLSGGYAGAKATQRLLSVYAQDEANRAGLDITFTTEVAGTAMIELVKAADPAQVAPAYRLSGQGLQKLP